MLAKIKYVIPGPWITLNEYINAERSNRFMAAKIKKDEMERIMWCLPSSQIKGMINVTFQAYVKDRKKDTDNLYILFCKFLLDSMVKKAIIENDGQKQIGRIIFEHPIVDKDERMEVVVEES